MRLLLTIEIKRTFLCAMHSIKMIFIAEFCSKSGLKTANPLVFEGFAYSNECVLNT